MKYLTPELIEKAKTAKTVEELQTLAIENGVDLSKCLFFKGGYCQRVEACLEGWRNLAPISV